MIRWSTVCRPKDFGGLGLQNLELMNIALLCKWWWKIVKFDGIWQQISKSKYVKNSCITTVRCKQGDSQFWSDFLKHKERFFSLCKFKVRNGQNIRFWIPSFGKKEKNLMVVGISAKFWTIWRLRNSAVFDNRKVTDPSVPVNMTANWLHDWSILQRKQEDQEMLRRGRGVADLLANCWRDFQEGAWMAAECWQNSGLRTNAGSAAPALHLWLALSAFPPSSLILALFRLMVVVDVSG